MEDLDLKDRRLLYELDINSRQTMQKLAKKLYLSKDAVKYRINRMINKGMIKSFNAIIDTGKLGFISFRLMIKFYRLSPEKENEIIEFFLSNKNLVWMTRAQGNWDISTWFLYKTLEEMNNFWKELLKKYNNYIEKRQFGIYSMVNYFSRAYFLGNQNNSLSMRIISLPTENYKIQKSDLRIIELLANNSRMSIVDVARKTNLTSKTVIRKIKTLETNKTIIGYRTEFDLEKLGYKYYKIHITIFNSTQEKIRKLKQFIFQHPNIIYDDEILGGYDIEIEVQVKNENELLKLIGELREKFSDIIRDYEIIHYYKEYRLKFFPVSAL